MKNLIEQLEAIKLKQYKREISKAAGAGSPLSEKEKRDIKYKFCGVGKDYKPDLKPGILGKL
jgi:hypothetical protein